MSPDGKSPALVVFDGIDRLNVSPELINVMKNKYTQIIFITYSSVSITELVSDIDIQLIRGCDIHSLQPLTCVVTTQRIVHSLVVSNDVFTPMNKEQELFEQLTELTLGSPPLVDITAAFVCQKFKSSSTPSADIMNNVILQVSNYGKNKILYYISHLIEQLNLSSAERLMLRVLAMFNSYPIPRSITGYIGNVINTSLTSLSTADCHKAEAEDVVDCLIKWKLLRLYPPSVLKCASSPHFQLQPLYYVPQIVLESVFYSMEDVDFMFAIATACHALHALLCDNPSEADMAMCSSLAENLLTVGYAKSVLDDDCNALLMKLTLM